MTASAAENQSGTVTFVLTDVARSTAMWDADPVSARTAIARHDEIIEAAVATCGGSLLKARGEGDSHFAVFDQAQSAVAAALEIACRIAAERWSTTQPLRIRMALHTGTADVRGGDYYGADVNRCARLRSVGHPGQVVLSNATAALVRSALPPGCGLLELGSHHLRDVAVAEHVYQLTHPELPVEFPPLATAERHHNVPTSLTSFVGRREEMAEVERLISSTRMVTLLGSGGVGKSRMALQAAAELLPDFSDGAFVVELGPLSDPALVPQQVLLALGVPEEPGRSHADTLVASLSLRHLLLVLDGCEHLLWACAELAEALLRSCPKVRVLATSREPLRISGETTWRVPSLAVPDAAALALGVDLEKFDAVRLFIDRALQSKPDFTVSPTNAAAIVEVCQRLEGIPLALELAATRVKVLSCEQIAARLNDQFRLLTGGARNALPRHQTLRAAVDWSHELLTPLEKALFRRLSVFAGGFSLEAAEAICCGDECGPEDVLDQLAGLVDKSLVAVEERSDRVRYRLLETLRQYAAERLREAEEQAELSDALLRWYLAEAQRAEPQLKGPEQGSFLDLLEDEHDNLRAALAWALEKADVDGLRLAVTLSRFWLVRGYLNEGRRWLEFTLAIGQCAPKPDRARGLIAASTLAWHQGDYGGVGPLAEKALKMSRELGDKVAEAEALCRLGELRTMTGDHVAARSLFEQSRAAWSDAGAKRGVIQSLNVPLHDLATLACEDEDYDEAEQLFREALDIAVEHGNTMDIVHHLSGLGHVARGRGEHAAARSAYQESLGIARRLGYKRMVAFDLQYLAGLALAGGDITGAAGFYRDALAYFGPAGDDLGTARCLEGLCKVAAAQARFALSARLSSAAERLRDAMHSPLPPSELPAYEAALRSARNGLGPDDFDAARGEGRKVELREAIQGALVDCT